MKKECFTCSHKLSRDLTKEEKDELQRKHVEKTGRKTLFIPNMEFKCNLTGAIISQTDPACDNYQGDDLMEGIRKDLSTTCKKLREGMRS